MNTLNEKTLQIPPDLRTTEKEDKDDSYSNFKAENANLFSLSSSNPQHVKHTSLSPKVSKPTAPTEISPTTGHRKFHSGLNKAVSRHEDEILDNSPVIVAAGAGSTFNKTAGKNKTM